MKIRVIVSALAVATAFGAAPAVSNADPSDALCPRAVSKVDGFTAAAKGSDVAKIADAAKAAADAYRLCMSDTRTSGPIEPRYNYDELRAAYFMSVLGRAQIALGKTADAATSLREARSLANEVAEWIPDSNSWSADNVNGTSSSRNTDRRPSQYKDAAVQIRIAADAALDRLSSTSSAPANPAAPSTASSPAPSAQHSR